MRAFGWALALAIAAFAAPGDAQLRGGVEQSEPGQATPPSAPTTPERSLCQNAFAGRVSPSDHTEIMPEEIGGGEPPRCAPPSPSWSLLGQDGNDCCYVVREPGAPQTPQESPPLIAQQPPTLRAGVRETYSSPSGGGSYAYPSPTMVGGASGYGQPPSQPPKTRLRGGASGGGSTAPRAPATQSDPVTIKLSDGFNVILSVPRSLTPNRTYTTSLARQAGSQSPWTSATILLIRAKTASRPGLLRLVSVANGSRTMNVGVLKEY